MPLLKIHQHRQSLLSALFVQPCHSLADPPLAVWMDGEGQYTDPGCPLTVHAENNRGPCVLQVASHAANEPCHWPAALMQLRNTSADTLSQGYEGRRIIGCDKSWVCYSALPIQNQGGVHGIDWYNEKQRAMNLQGEIKMAERMNVTQKKSRNGDDCYQDNLSEKAASFEVNATKAASSLQMQQYSI